MLSDEVLEKVIERLTQRIEQGNIYILKKIGNNIKRIGKLKPIEAEQLAQILKYGGDFDKITKKLAEITELNVKDIYKIFEEVAKHDYQFAKQFYEYRKKKFIPYEQNNVLKNQIKALANITAQEYVNIANTRILGFGLQDKDGNIIFKGLKQVYEDVIDKAVLSVAQGKTTFQEEMANTIKELGGGGLKTISNKTYIDKNGIEKHYVRRLDSAVKMNMKDALRNLHNEEQKIFGQEFDSDGVEISVHLNPAPDHEEVQGRQFSNEQFDNFQNDIDAIDYSGKEFPAEFEGHDRRSISEYNCYHYTFAIVLGISKPQYSNEQLQEIIDNNKKGFELDGKHYTNYEGTQLQRQLETKIREQKDIQIMARESDNPQLVGECQKNISALTKKYKELSQASGLPTKMQRMKVSGYKRINVNGINKTKNNALLTPNLNKNIIVASHYTKEENYNSIMKNGFTLEKSGSEAGNTFGKGIYFSNKQMENDYWKWRIDNSKEIKANIDTTGFLNVEYNDYVDDRQYVDIIVNELKENEKKQYNKLLKQYKEDNKIAYSLMEKEDNNYKKYLHINEKSDAICKVLEENYPGLIVNETTPSINIITGGSQIVVYDLKRIYIQK